MSFFENRSTLLVALTDTDCRPALRCTRQALLSRWPCMVEAAKEAIVQFVQPVSNWLQRLLSTACKD